MGGCRENNRAKWIRSPEGTLKEIISVGYNWGIAPIITAMVLEKVQHTYLLSSQLPRDLQFYATSKDFSVLKSKEGEIVNKRYRAFMRDIDNCTKENAFTNKQALCDPLTLMMALYVIHGTPLNFTGIKVNWHIYNANMKLKEHLLGQPYLKHNEILSIEKTNDALSSISELIHIDDHERLLNHIISCVKKALQDETT